MSCCSADGDFDARTSREQRLSVDQVTGQLRIGAAGCYRRSNSRLRCDDLFARVIQSVHWPPPVKCTSAAYPEGTEGVKRLSQAILTKKNISAMSRWNLMNMRFIFSFALLLGIVLSTSSSEALRSTNRRSADVATDNVVQVRHIYGRHRRTRQRIQRGTGTIGRVAWRQCGHNQGQGPGLGFILDIGSVDYGQRARTLCVLI